MVSGNADTIWCWANLIYLMGFYILRPFQNGQYTMVLGNSDTIWFWTILKHYDTGQFQYTMVLGSSDTIWHWADPIHWPQLVQYCVPWAAQACTHSWEPGPQKGTLCGGGELGEGSIVLASPTLVASWTNTAHPREPLQAGKSSDRLHSFLSIIFPTDFSVLWDQSTYLEYKCAVFFLHSNTLPSPDPTWVKGKALFVIFMNFPRLTCLQCRSGMIKWTSMICTTVVRTVKKYPKKQNLKLQNMVLVMVIRVVQIWTRNPVLKLWNENFYRFSPFVGAGFNRMPAHL